MATEQNPAPNPLRNPIGVASPDLASNPPAESDTQTISLMAVCCGLFKQHWFIVGSLAILTVWFSYLALLKLCRELGLGPSLKNLVPGVSIHRFCHDKFVQATTANDLLLGITGIYVGFLVALIIERANYEKSQILHGETTRIREATDFLKSITAGVAEEIKQAAEEAKRLVVITDYQKLLDQIGKVIEHASRSDGELLIMNLTASFGYFMTFDSDHVLDTDHLSLTKAAENRNEALKLMLQRNYFGRWTDLLEKQSANEKRLKRCAIGGENRPKKRVTYVTLRAEKKSGETEPVPFISQYLEPSLKQANVRAYQTNEETAFSGLPADGNKLYLAPKSIISKDPKDDAKKDFEEHLVQNQISKIRELRDAHIKVAELDQIPFQLYVSLPPDGKDRESGMCLFMFVNQHTLGRTNNLAAFVTTDAEILGAFKTIIESVIAQGKWTTSAPTINP